MIRLYRTRTNRKSVAARSAAGAGQVEKRMTRNRYYEKAILSYLEYL
jgi:hypothetical protein